MTSEKKTINAPRVLLELDPPAHPSGYKEGWGGRNGTRRWQLLGHHSCGWDWHNSQAFSLLPFGAGVAVRSFKGIQHSQLYIDKWTKSKCQWTLSNWIDLGRHNHTWNTSTAHTGRFFKFLHLAWKVNWSQECSVVWEFQIPVTTKASFLQGMSIFLLPENDKQA